MNFIVLTAALSAMNAQLYVATRMLYSLARADLAPSALGQVGRNGAPLRALAVSTFGVALAAICSIALPGDTFVLVMSIAMFGALFAWLMIFVTHYRFRRSIEESGGSLEFRMWGFPYLTIAGGVIMFAILFTTLLLPEFRMTLLIGIPLLVALNIAYSVMKSRSSGRAPVEETL
ncbi:putative transport protein YifK [compost metagenome]